MNFERQLRNLMTLEDPGPDFAAGVIKRMKGRTISRRRLVLVSTALVFAAAAAMLGLQLPEPHPVVADEPGQAAPAPLPSDAVRSTEPVAAVVIPTAISGTNASKSFTVAVLPLTLEPDVSVSRMAVESFYVALLEKLRKVPDLVLVDPQAPSQYRIAVKGLAPTTGRGIAASNTVFAASVTSAMNSSSNSLQSNVTASSGQWRVQVVADFAQQTPDATGSGVPTRSSGSGVSISPASGIATTWETYQDGNGVRVASFTGSYLAGECIPYALQDARQACPEPADAASTQVDLLRKRIFPAEKMLRDMVVELQNPALTGQARVVALVELQAVGRRENAMWDAATLHAILELATRPRIRSSAPWPGAHCGGCAIPNSSSR